MRHIQSVFVSAVALACGLSVPAMGQSIIYSANPPRVQASASNVSPMGLPACGTNDPTSPTPGVLYCYSPGYIWTAYNILPVLNAGN